MAIDTALKRRSAAQIYTGVLPISITPDASKPVAWRQDAGWGYAGIAAAAPPVVDDNLNIYIPTFRRRRR